MSKALCIVSPLTGQFGPAKTEPGCGSCYEIDIGVVLGVIACDIILTFLIAFTVFCLVTFQKRSRLASRVEGKEKTLIASQKTVEITESPYQELHGVQSEVYSDLQQFRK